MKEPAIEQAWQGPAQCRRCGIRDLVLFADLQHGDFRLIHRPIDELELVSGSLLYRRGDAPHYLYTVRAGSIKLIHYPGEGGLRIVRLLSRGDIVGLEALLGHPYQHEARILEPASLCRIPVAVIERLNRDTPRLYRQLMSRWQRSVSEADGWLTDFLVARPRPGSPGCCFTSPMWRMARPSTCPVGKILARCLALAPKPPAEPPLNCGANISSLSSIAAMRVLTLRRSGDSPNSLRSK